jgi:PKD repeat protein
MRRASGGRRHRLATTVAVAVVASLAVWASTASAAIIRLPNGEVVSYQPLRGAAQDPIPYDIAFRNMDYNGGPVMPSNTDYMVFWSPGGLSAYGSGSPPEYVSGLEQYFTDLSHDSGGHENTDSVAAQYNDLTGAFARYHMTFGGAILDTDPYPASTCPVTSPVTACLDDAQLQAEVEKVAAANHIPADLSHEFFILTPPNVAGCFTNDAGSGYGGCSANEVPSSLAAYCAYHGQTNVSPMRFYAYDPYITGNSGCDDGNHPNGPSDGAIEGGLSHEHLESVTDPIPNDAWTNGAGNYHGDEIGDQCEGEYGTPLGTAADGAEYNQVINGHDYWYQEEWSNQGHTCLQRYTPPATLPTATFSATAGSGLTMKFNGAGSTAPGGIADLSWQFNALFGQATFEQPGTSITHTFPAAGAYSVGLAVFGKDGLSTGTGGIVTTGHSGFTPGFTVSPGNPVAGRSVTFKGLTTVSQHPVSNYLWEFGDGSTGSGAKPVHVYAKPGTYRVTVVLFSGIGSAFPGAGAAPVYARTIVVRKAATKTTVAAPGAGKAGVVIPPSSIRAALSGATADATGEITFKVFGPRSTPPTACTSGGSTVGAATVSGNGTYHPSAGFKPKKSGKYWWYASYSGDAANSPSHSACGRGMAARTTP